MGENPISRAIGRGEPWKLRLLWALKWQRVKRVPFGPQKVDYLNIWVGCWMLVACLLQQLYGFKHRHLYQKNGIIILYVLCVQTIYLLYCLRSDRLTLIRNHSVFTSTGSNCRMFARSMIARNWDVHNFINFI